MSKENYFLTRYSTNLALLLVNIFLIYISRQSEVGNLAYFLLPNQNIASGKVSMNYLEQTINHIYLITAANIFNTFLFAILDMHYMYFQLANALINYVN